nr:MAG TPA: hypothetical protein [Bacteriophage sp.]
MLLGMSEDGDEIISNTPKSYDILKGDNQQWC